MRKLNVAILLLLGSLAAGTFACTPLDLYEKNVSIPGHAWEKEFKPSFTFVIRDTTAVYDLKLVLRHSDRYNYNNIWLNLGIQGPGQDSATRIRMERILATDEKGWLASGMDDLYEHRISVNDILSEQGISLRKAGTYRFTLEQIMRENPLRHVLNAGLRIEKKP